jgi:Peptidase family M28
MNHKHPLIKPMLIPAVIAFWLLLIALACNLSDDAAPPTLMLRATTTPPPTIGYATLAPDDLPVVAATGVPNFQAAMLALLNQVETDRLVYHVNNLINFGTRHVNSPYDNPSFGIGAARDYITNEFNLIAQNARGTMTVFPHTFDMSWGGVNSRATNVVATIGGTEEGAGVIVIGAHYDSISIDVNSGSVPAPGANDNATGVAALLELARILTQRQHRATILFVAFSAEEIGRIGSKRFVEEYIRGIDVRVMINLDIIGSSTGPNGASAGQTIRAFSEEPNNSASRQFARGFGLLVNQYMPQARVFVEATVDRAGRYSDHMSFNEIGIPAVRFIETLEDPNRNHTDRDLLDDIQPAYLTMSTQMVLAVVTSLADGPRYPRNISLRVNPSGTRTLIWEPVADAAEYIVAVRAPGQTEFSGSFRTTNISVEWEKFTPEFYEAIAIAGVNNGGIIGQLSPEYVITN